MNITQYYEIGWSIVLKASNVGSQFSYCPKQRSPNATAKYLDTVADLSTSDLYIIVSIIADKPSSFSYDTNIKPNDNAANAHTSTDKDVSVIIGIKTSKRSYFFILLPLFKFQHMQCQVL